MKRRLLSLLMALSLSVGLALPGAAAGVDEQLAEVTLEVKETLGLDTEAYERFYGDLQENLLAPTWFLEWSGENGSMSVNATGEGKILSYYRWDNEPSNGQSSFGPTFPAGDRETARAAAVAFLDRVLTEGESITLEDRGRDSLYMSSYNFQGEILLNGLKAGLSFRISVDCESNEVTNFSRDDLNGRVMGEIPSPTAAVTPEQAKPLLGSPMAMRLEYVLAGGEEKKAVLRYLPEGMDTYYVDARTGELVNLTQLASETERGGGSFGVMNGAAADKESAAAPAPELSEAEQAGVDKLEGVLDREELDRAARGVTALGLENYTLSALDYAVSREEESDEVTATLRYSRQVEDRFWRRTVTLDARTGELIRVYSSGSLGETRMERKVDHAEARKAAMDFLLEHCPEQAARTDLYRSYDAMEGETALFHSFTFAQKENGYFYPGNTLEVGVDTTDGSISTYRKSFDDEITFAHPAGICTMEEALAAWLDTYTVELGYVWVPVALDDSRPDYAPLLEAGVGYLYRLTLGYTLEREDYPLGVDAHTGKAVYPEELGEETGLTYDDLEGHWARPMIERLAGYGVGFEGGAFGPDRALTQLDLLYLVLVAQGYGFDLGREEDVDRLYDTAVRLGLLTREERDEEAVLTRIETVRILLDGMGFAHVARLEGIFRTDFTDDGKIAPGDYGYAALARGLGLVTGTETGAFGGEETATRAQAAVMLHNLMDR